MPKRSVEQPQDQSIRRIPLTQGKYAIVDVADYAWLMSHNWHARRNKWGYYATRNVPKPGGGQTTVDMHREILGLDSSCKTTGDHINRDTLNNRRGNLRTATNQQQSMNRGVRCDSQSGYRGVHRSGNKWRAKIQVGSKRLHLGYAGTPEAAFALYRTAAAKHFGEFDSCAGYVPATQREPELVLA